MPHLQTIKEEVPLPTTAISRDRDDYGIRMEAHFAEGGRNPSWFEEGFVNESWSIHAEAFQAKKGPLFLMSGRQPLVGMRTETNILITDGSWFRLSGVVSNIGRQPTDADLDNSTSSNWNNHEKVCTHKDCPFITGTREDKRHEMFKRYGALHGQRIQSLAVLNNDFHDYFQRPIAENQVVLLDLVCDDNKHNIWQVEGITVLDDAKTEGLPPFFLHFMDIFGKGKTCNCSNCVAMLNKIISGVTGVSGCNCSKCRPAGDKPRRRNPNRRALASKN